MSASEGFSVDLESLTAFGHELTTQLSGMASPLSHLQAIMGDKKMDFGRFPEAKKLWHNHGTAAEQMSVLVNQARDAISFAEEITKSVSVAYQHYDHHTTSTLTGLGSLLDPTIGSAAGPILDGVGNAIASITGGVDHTVNSLTGGLTGLTDGIGSIAGLDDITGLDNIDSPDDLGATVDGTAGTIDGTVTGAVDQVSQVTNPQVADAQQVVNIIGALNGTTGGSGPTGATGV